MIADYKVLMERSPMAADDGRVLHLVDRIYESVDRPELWPVTIQAIGELLGGRRHFWDMDRRDQRTTFARDTAAADAGCQPTFFLSRTDVKSLDEYEHEFGELIIRFLKIVFLSILGSPNEVRAREAIGLVLTRRYVEAFESLHGRPEPAPPGSARRKLIAALWEDGHAFSRDNLHTMRLLTPHLDRAVRLQVRLSFADVRADRVTGALDVLTVGVILVDRSGRPVWLNRRAREIMHDSNGVRLRATGLVAQRPADTRSLHELVQGAVSAGSQGFSAISRGENSRPLLAIAVPLKPPGGIEAADESAAGVVFISDPDRTDKPSLESLRRAFNLTYREAQAAVAVSNGHGLKAAAKAMGVAPTTVRSQLQQAFAKTGTKHQAELAALVHKTLTHVRYEPEVETERPD
jgi:DNA-binding CsgD family transcriptional regulator/PAS domain-containing protein